MPSTVEELTKNRVKLTIEVPFSELKPHLDKAYRAIAQKITIPGFRKGHVPQAIIDQRVGTETVLNEALNEILPNAFNAALEEHQIVPLGDPKIEVTQAEKGKDVVFVAEVDKRPEFTMPSFADVKVEVDALSDDESDVDERLETLRERFATQKEVSRKAKKGDIVTVDLKGSKDGEDLADASAEGVSFKVGNGAMMEGLDKAVTGLKAGESATFTSTLVGGPLKGTEADIEVTVHKVAEQELPALDDEFAQMVSEFDTVEEMKADLAQATKQMALMDQAADARDKALLEIVKATDLELPEEMLKNEITNRKANVEAQLAQAGMKLEDYLEQVEEGKSVDEFWTELEENTESAIKAQLILDKLAEDTDVQVDQTDLTQHLIRRAQASGSSPEQEMQHMMEHNHIGEWVAEIRRNKALEAMMGEVTITDTKGEKVDLSILNPKVAEPPVEADDEAADEAPAEAPAEAAKPKKKAKKAAASADSPESADSPDSPDSPASAK